ncbi:helix-turn-helix transcriptional regulator [Neptunicella marina]|uniref:Helix-turn-helix transcriptional regulator n=1 Tax=Neptunicella marina TaxID=2125989 RepID=A0A8J6M0C6_9ALTE|nr:AraC family transcriptional regulator [Neptunicella marina]MBC3767150.1 helix-turn-helix transcriptional regulator [Neptunicella marina]
MIQSPELLRRLLRAKDCIDGAPHEDWSIKRLAQVSFVSVAHFARQFKKAFGSPPHRYVLTRRIERAMALLRDTELPITEIALQTGWNSIGTFGRIFSDITGESPGEFRARECSVSHARQDIPECVIRAVDRPNLNIAVSEKRRLEVAGKLKLQSK